MTGVPAAAAKEGNNERKSGQTRLVLVGAGKMGGAMAAGWLAGGLPGVVADDPRAQPVRGDRPARGVDAASRSTRADPAAPDVLALAVKPQALDAVAPRIAALASERTLVLSILAGKTIANLKARLPGARAVVRAMPNTPAAIGRGVTAAFAEPRGRRDEQRRWTERLLGAVGAFHWLDDEGAIDVVTAISGGGPAYVFALTEALAAAAEALGLPPELAMSLARGTVEGRGRTDATRARNAAFGSAPQRHVARRHDRGGARRAARGRRPPSPDGARREGGARASGEDGRMTAGPPHAKGWKLVPRSPLRCSPRGATAGAGRTTKSYRLYFLSFACRL